MSLDARLQKLAPVLTAQERAVLVLGSLKNKTPEDLAWRRTMPDAQVPEFNRLIDLMNAVNREFALLITLIEKEGEKLDLRLSWLLSLHLWQLNLAEINFAASLVAREAITESEHTALVEKHRDDFIPISQLAVIVAEERCAWSDEDLEQPGWTRELIVKPDAWQRLQAEAEAMLRQAVANGALEGRGKGACLSVRRTSFDAWMERPVTLYPAWAGGYEVVPDTRAVHVESERNTLRHLRETIENTPLGPSGPVASRLICRPSSTRCKRRLRSN